jgi:ketosteroid isomerase-like protein
MSTTIEQNKAVIRAFFDAWNGRQPDAFDDLIAPDIVRHPAEGLRPTARHIELHFARRRQSVDAITMEALQAR